MNSKFLREIGTKKIIKMRTVRSILCGSLSTNKDNKWPVHAQLSNCLPSDVAFGGKFRSCPILIFYVIPISCQYIEY